MYIILKPRLLQFYNISIKLVAIVISGFLLVLAGMIIKYKPAYEVWVAGESLGYVENVEEFKEQINEEVLTEDGENIADISLEEEPKYTMLLLSRNSNTNEQEIIEKINEENKVVTYKYYQVSLNNETNKNVATLDEAEQVVNEIKNNYEGDGLDINLQINEFYTTDAEDLKEDAVEVATKDLETAVDSIKEEKEKENALAVINHVKLSVLPVSGKITSRYGVSSSIRRSTHTGLDIACSSGTAIKVVADGTVTFAAYSGSYGNLVKVDHGNGVETWYGHCSKIYSKVGDKVKAGDVISAVGSTGNSTGPHLHFEIRINGNTVNPQNYVY